MTPPRRRSNPIFEARSKFCHTESGECLCDHESQTGCGDEEICNTSGYCQPRPGCYNNADCEHLVDHFCDITTRLEVKGTRRRR